jgi:hypothetical protein
MSRGPNPRIVVLASGDTHLRNHGVPVAWCGLRLAGEMTVFHWEPGCDWGENERDCLDCVRALVRLRDGNAGGMQ